MIDGEFARRGVPTVIGRSHERRIVRLTEDRGRLEMENAHRLIHERVVDTLGRGCKSECGDASFDSLRGHVAPTKQDSIDDAFDTAVKPTEGDAERDRRDGFDDRGEMRSRE